MTYTSSQQSGDKLAQLRRKMEKECNKLNSSWKGVDSKVPPKPKNMHWETYNRIIERVKDLMIEHKRAYYDKLRSLLDRF